MSLLGALDAGRSALAVQQAAIQVTSNNIANVGDPNYTRQIAIIAPAGDQLLPPNMRIGTGVDLVAIQRQVDDALQSRLRGSMSDKEAAGTGADWLSRVESALNELHGQGLSSQLSTFFSSWSNLANKPQDIGQRQVVIQSGDSVAKWMQNLRGQLGSLAGNVADQMKTNAKAANDLANRVADLNGQIVSTEGGTTAQANGLRDQRDAALQQLAQLMDVKTVEQPNGVVNVYCGSETLVDGTNSRGVGLAMQDVNGQPLPTLVFTANGGGDIPLSSGKLSGLQTVAGQMQGYIAQVDGLAHNLIFQLNKIHSSGQGLNGFTGVVSTNAVADATKALTDPAAGLNFVPSNGSFVVHVTNTLTGLSTSTLVPVSLTGAPSDTTLNGLGASLAAINGVNATVAGGRLSINAANSSVQISFSQDSSGALAALGINNFYTGKDASDIAVSSALSADPSLLAAAKNGDKADNQTALAISQLESAPLAALGGQSLKDNYQTLVNTVGTQVSSAKANATAAQAVQDTLQSQRDALSGVSMDEEAINLMRQQRAFQAASKVISTVDQLMNTLMQLVA